MVFWTEMVAVRWKGMLGLGIYCEDGAHPVTIGVELECMEMKEVKNNS